MIEVLLRALYRGPAPRAGDCPQGGSHDWVISGHIATCTKCGASQNVS